MLIYILKFSGCLSLFMIFYKLFLEKESFHNLKRFYLLGVLLVSVSIPLITFTQYVEIASIPNTTNELSNFEFVNDVSNKQTIQTSWKDHIPSILWSIYFIGLLVFSFRFVKHLYQMYYRIKTNEKLKDKAFTNVLLLDKINPHTFFKYIFLNKHKYESNAIPKEVLLHEQTHAKQLHALDIIIVELTQVIFWFNPLLYFIKKDIKLNHEFLADQSVLKLGTEPTNYQQLLLAFSSNACEPQLANAINYSSIKKRLTVMKTQTTKSRTWIKSLLLLPLLSVLVYGFSSEKVEYLYSETNHTARSIEIEILENDIYSIDGVEIHKNSLVTSLNKLHQDISPEVRNNIMNIHVSSSKKITDEDVWFIYNALLDYGFHRMVTPDQEIVLSKGNKPFAIDNKSTNSEIELYLNSKGELFYNNQKIEIQELASIQTLQDDIAISIETTLETDVEITKKISKSIQDYLRNSGLKGFSVCVNSSNDNLKTNLRNKQLVIMVQVNSILINGVSSTLDTFKNDLNFVTKNWEETDYTSVVPTILIAATKKEFLQNLEKEFSKTHFSKANYGVKLTSLSNIKQQSATREQMKAYNTWAKKINKQIELAIKTENSNSPKSYPIIKLKVVEKYKYIYSIMSDKQRKDVEPFPNLPEAPPPPPPPPPKDPLDHIINMAKKGAIFYLEGKKVSSDKAIDALKNNRSLNISTKNSNTKQPKVYITKKGITIKKETPSPKTGFINVKGEKLYYTNLNNKITYYNRYGVVTDENGKELKPNQQTNASDVLPNSNITKVFKDDQIVSEFKNTDIESSIPTPPKDIPSMLELANKGAVFYYEGKEISGKKAIKLTDNNKDLNILIRDIDSKKPIVKLSTNPIRI